MSFTSSLRKKIAAAVDHAAFGELHFNAVKTSAM